MENNKKIKIKKKIILSKIKENINNKFVTITFKLKLRI